MVYIERVKIIDHATSPTLVNHIKCFVVDFIDRFWRSAVTDCWMNVFLHMKYIRGLLRKCELHFSRIIVVSEGVFQS